MKKQSAADILSLKAAIRTAARAARRMAFRNGLPVAVSKNGKVVFIYKDNREVIANSTSIFNPK